MNSSLLKAINRRASLLTLGATGLTAALANPPSTGAKKKHGKKRDKQLKPDALCKKQIGQCFDFFTPMCDDDPSCLAVVDRCCPSLGSCDLDGFFACANQAASVQERFGPLKTLSR